MEEKIIEVAINKKYCTYEYFKYMQSLDIGHVRWMTDEELEKNELYEIIERENF